MIEKILSLISRSGKSDYAIEHTLGFTQGTISNWRRGKNKVSTEAIIKLARYFGVSTDYLLGLSEDSAQKNFVNSPVVTGNDNAVAVNGSTIYAAGDVALDDELIRLYREFSEEEKSILLGYAKRIVEERKK